ncbi:MAG: sensor histidine kinase [Bacteroidetes bacterium]|nr:sensor histidine kinase [Bacteroidota bacterium]
MLKKFDLRRFLYNGKLLFILICSIITVVSLLLSGQIARELRTKEVHDVKLWSTAITQLANDSKRDYEYNFKTLAVNIVGTNSSIPTIMTDNDLNIISYRNIPKNIAKDSVKLRSYITKMAKSNDPIIVTTDKGYDHYIFYTESHTLTILKVFPFIQLLIIVVFIVFSYITFRSSIKNKQNKVWIGMAKETAHQLGSPTSSLLGWLEYLKSQDIDNHVIEEMNKDISRLMKVVERFSKIGSTTQLEPRNITEIINGTVNYFKVRVPKNTTLEYISNENNPLQAMVNEALFDWVIENMIKNAIDAVQGKGSIVVTTHDDKENIYIDVTDSGKGMSKSVQDKIFNPGYTTKTRGWGLGLSLSHRIINDYHKGNIYVAYSEPSKGTTMRIVLKRL